MPRRPTNAHLPAFIEPMLATLHAPFDSPEHLFEVKWDGFRSLAFRDAGGLRLTGRRRTDFTERFPELRPLGGLPNGTVLDGEIVLLKNGRPDFSALLKRERAWNASAEPGRRRPPQAVVFIAFDLLYERGRAVLNLPLIERLNRLKKVVAPLIGANVALSDIHVGSGLALFEEANRRQLEGVVAKRMDSVYEPGRRSGAWTKFKRRHTIMCAIIGYEMNTAGGLKSLLLAGDEQGELRFVGKVGSGISPGAADKILAKIGRFQARQPAVPASIRQARWLKPGLVCRVSFAEWTNDGKLRQPVFEALV